MSGTDNGPKGSGRRWWEIRGGREPDEGRYGDLVTGGQGRSRPERSLSVGANPSDESRHPRHRFLWPVVSVVAVGALIVGGGFGVSKLRAKSASELTSPVAAAPGSAQGESPAPLDDLPDVGGGMLPTLEGAGGVPDGTGGGSDGSAEGSDGNQGSQPTGTPTSGSNTPQPVPFLEVSRPAPAAPEPQQDGPPVPGNGCATIGTGVYACVVTQDAPAYPAGASKPTARLPADRYRFLCQSDGSVYSIENRTNHWWAWMETSSAGVWIPVIFLKGNKDDSPQPGLPVCGSEPAPIATSAPTTTSTSPETPYSSRASVPSASSSANPN
ncbi:MAG: hypothetical protein M3313_01015 [Actinomycetota bacterium]|nr:hypothetical protein [Actinomycetota bacterium]